MFQTQDKDRLAVGKWLLFMAFMILIMVMVGGATRLTESGLSMVRWEPFSGIIPPLNAAEWQAEFNDYKKSPEFILKNFHMTVEDFKTIYYWEWGHRVLGRLLGLFFAIPLVWFWIKGRIPAGYKPKLLVLLFLGGMQGVLGWVMVSSGLQKEPAVSHYLLTAHLSAALFLFSVILWQAFNLLLPTPSATSKPVKIMTHSLMALLVLQIVMGALIAGLDAGRVFNTWPSMNGQFIPAGIMDMSPWWRNFIDNAATLQFDHRMVAYLMFALVLALFFKSRSGVSKPVKQAAFWMVIVIFLQIVIGVVMLLKHVPVDWGTLHQGGGAIVLGFLVYLMHLQRKTVAT